MCVYFQELFVNSIILCNVHENIEGDVERDIYDQCLWIKSIVRVQNNIPYMYTKHTHLQTHTDTHIRNEGGLFIVI